MRNFTVGEWKADTKTVRVSCPVFFTVRVDDTNIAIVPSTYGISEQEALANARLITAAPKMYELLNMAMWSLRHHSDNDGIIACHIGKLLASIDGDSDVKTQESEP